MMPEISISAISDILESFDVEEVRELFRDQIANRQSYSATPLDQFQPIYINYNKLLQSEDADEDELLEGREKFNQICETLLSIIEEQFDVDVDDGYLDDNAKNKPAIVLAFYNFFVLDIYSNIQELLFNYIMRNQGSLYEKFKDVPRKSISGITLTPNGEVIFRNIYDICTYILGELTVESAFDYFDEGYLPMTVIKNLHQQGFLEGDFISAIAEIFNRDTGFKSQIGFDLMYALRKTALVVSDSETE